MTRKRNNYTSEFKAQMISLIESGKPRKEVLSEYNLNSSILDRWNQNIEIHRLKIIRR